MSALISFLGGSVFRMIWGEASAYFTKKQDHQHEVERMKIQGELDAAQHARNLESIKVQADLQVKVIEVQSKSDLDKIDVSAWATAVTDVGKQTGIKLIDIWNGIIRPWLATMATIMVLIQFVQHGFVMTDWDKELVGAILGIYVADRSLKNRGK